MYIYVLFDRNDRFLRTKIPAPLIYAMQADFCIFILVLHFYAIGCHCIVPA